MSTKYFWLELFSSSQLCLSCVVCYVMASSTYRLHDWVLIYQLVSHPLASLSLNTQPEGQKEKISDERKRNKEKSIWCNVENCGTIRCAKQIDVLQDVCDLLLLDRWVHWPATADFWCNHSYTQHMGACLTATLFLVCNRFPQVSLVYMGFDRFSMSLFLSTIINIQ